MNERPPEGGAPAEPEVKRPCASESSAASDAVGVNERLPEVNSEPRITLITRTGCHLCDVAKEAIARVSELTGAGWTEVNLDGDLDLEREYGDRVPVILLDGSEHGYWRVEEARLLRDLGPATRGRSASGAGG